MPFETTLEDYKDIFMYAWKKGLKGVTSFHEGASMDGILSTKKEEKDSDLWRKIEVLANSKKRPEVLPCDIYEMQVNKERVVVLVGKDNENNEPYEVFLTIDSDSLIKLGSAKEGEIRKTKKGKYDLIIKGKKSTFVLEDITSVFDDDYAVMCRLMSLAMRHHIPLQFIVDQLNKTKRFDTFSKTMARVLKKYIADGEKVISHSDSKCPECGGELVYKEGCKQCTKCFWSKCG
jgi:ribonucleoside-diphosphate reductase alpha chain